MPLRGLLGPDDERRAYDLSKIESMDLRKNGFLSKEGIHYYRTDLRLENSHNVKNDIERLAERGQHIEIFTHEWAFQKELPKLRVVCETAKRQGYSWVFPAIAEGGNERNVQIL